MLDSFDRTIARQIESWLRELAADLASALARHLNCQHGAGWYNDMEVGAPLWPNGASMDDRVDIFLDGLLGIAYETTMPEAASFADRYLAIVRDAAYAAACGVAVVAIADTYDTLYTPYAVFDPMFEDQSNEPDFPAQTGDQWRTAAAHIDKTHHTATKISANRREALDCYSGSPVWPLIEAKLSTAPIASTSLKASAEPSRHRLHFGIRCLRS